MGNYLAVDLGSSNGKVVLCSLGDDKKLSIREVGRFITPRVWANGHLCINIYDMFEQVCRIIGEVGKDTKITSIGADSWSGDFAIVNSDGDMIGLPVFYRDKRTEGMISEVEKVISYKELYRLTTQRRVQDMTLCQLLALKKYAPKQLEAGQMMAIGDLMMYLFTGRVCSEFSVASYTQLYSTEKKMWMKEVFDMFGLPTSLQAPVVHAGDVLGTVREEIAHSLGIEPFKVIAPPVHDTSAACAAAPAMDGENWACISTGSWYLISMEVDSPANWQLSYKYNLSNTGLAFGKTLLKRNVCAMWLLQECKRMWEKRGIECDYPLIAAKAAKAEPFKAFVDTDDDSFHNPDDMVSAVCEYVEKTGQGRIAEDDIGAIARMIYESIAFKCRWGLEALKATTGRKVDKLYVVGGVSGVDFLNEMLASAMNLEVTACVQEAAAVGNGLMQAYGNGDIKDSSELRSIVRASFPERSFSPVDPAAWDSHYAAFLDLCHMESVN